MLSRNAAGSSQQVVRSVAGPCPWQVPMGLVSVITSPRSSGPLRWAHFDSLAEQRLPHGLIVAAVSLTKSLARPAVAVESNGFGLDGM